MTMKTLRERQRDERVRYVARLLEETGSVRQAAKVAAMDRKEFRRVAKTPILTPLPDTPTH